MTRIHFCKSFDGARIAYANAGRGPAMVEVATWLNHLEHDWKSPVWGPRLAELSNHFSLTRYDSRGCGLSDRNVESLTFDGCLRDLEAVVDAAGLKHFVLLGCCQGSGLAIAYAARHPERVSHLVLYGAFARGRMSNSDGVVAILRFVRCSRRCSFPTASRSNTAGSTICSRCRRRRKTPSA
jgi:pimeloyl-ACP methyl ester carboxylesterase